MITVPMGTPTLVNSVLKTIGNTPVVRLQRLVPPGAADVLVKLEYFNPTGSYKDRMALAMIEGAERRGTLKPGMRVIEYTGGSTGSSLAMVCAMKGYEFHPLSSDAFSEEKLNTMRAFGADLELIPSDGGRVTPALFDKFKARIAELAKQPNTFFTDQFNNDDALDGYEKIGRELIEQVGRVDAFVGAVGSGGMLSGVSRALKAAGSKARVIALEPATCPLLTTGKGGPHRVEGTAPGFWPPHLTKDVYDEARAIDENEGRAIARRAAREEGIFAGTSSGLNIKAAIDVARELGPGKVIATVAVDTGLKYLTGDLYKRDQ
ncbi:MAG TPA: cysteine synthase family protein [Vicinamibacterales bacterium]|nr:cysteine synthase family protein [Vicinamibacterales bacterium]